LILKENANGSTLFFYGDPNYGVRRGIFSGIVQQVIEDMAKIKITRHYRFEEGDSENKEDSVSASPGETKAIVKDKLN
jgi:hypothetical protein